MNARMDQAERAVVDGIARLEHLLDDFGAKVKTTSQRVQHWMDMGARPKRELMHLKEKAQTTLAPIASRGKDMSKVMVSGIRRNPIPFAIGAAVIGGYFVYRYMKRRPSVKESIVETDAEEMVGFA